MSATVAATAAQLNMQLRIQRLGTSRSQLMRDYYDAVPALAPFFAGCPWDAAAVRRVAGRVAGQFDAASRAAMQEAIQPTTEAARAKLERIAAGDGFFVVTGQQAGLLTGPLFTIYKTITAIKAAEAYEAVLGVPVAPLFWVAADDHDFPEVNHAHVIGADNDLHRIEIAAADDVPRSMSRQLLGNGITATVDALSGILPANEFAQQAIEWVRTSYRPDRTVADAFADLLRLMFSQHDLLITSSAHPVVKRLGVSVIQRELEHAEAHEAAVRRQTDKLVAAGYHEQVSVRAGAANVLYEDETGRDRLTHEHDHWQLSRSKRRFEYQELIELVDETPERFSPNVHLRPIVSNVVFPTIAYVGGPAEVSYYAQIGCLFEQHGVPMPLVVPRASLELVEHKVQKVLDKFGLGVEDVHQPFDQLTSRVIRDELPVDVTTTVQALRTQIADGYAQLVAATQTIDPTLKGPLENARNASHKALADAEKKLVSHLKKKNEIGIEQLRKASVNLYPNGQTQERALSGVSYLARYGPAFIDALSAEIGLQIDRQAPDWQGVACD